MVASVTSTVRVDPLRVVTVKLLAPTVATVPETAGRPRPFDPFDPGMPVWCACGEPVPLVAAPAAPAPTTVSPRAMPAAVATRNPFRLRPLFLRLPRPP